MISTKGLLAALKLLIDSPSWTIGKLDQTKNETICLYGGISGAPYRATVGGGGRGYDEGRYRLVVRHTTNFDAAERKAAGVYDSIAGVNTPVEGKTTWIFPVYAAPVALGTDEKGVYEFAVDFKTISER